MIKNTKFFVKDDIVVSVEEINYLLVTNDAHVLSMKNGGRVNLNSQTYKELLEFIVDVYGDSPYLSKTFFDSLK